MLSIVLTITCSEKYISLDAQTFNCRGFNGRFTCICTNLYPIIYMIPYQCNNPLQMFELMFGPSECSQIPLTHTTHIRKHNHNTNANSFCNIRISWPFLWAPCMLEDDSGITEWFASYWMFEDHCWGKGIALFSWHCVCGCCISSASRPNAS